MDSVENKITAFIELASQQERSSGVAEILRYIAESLDAAACLLWQVASFENGRSNPPLWVVAHWTKDGTPYTSRDLPANSLTGNAIRLNESIVESVNNPKVHKVHKDWFIEKLNVQWMCSIPLRFDKSVLGALRVHQHEKTSSHRSNEISGALNLYRDQDQVFSKNDLVIANNFATVLPSIYRSIQERAAFELIVKVREEVANKERELEQARMREGENANHSGERASRIQRNERAARGLIESVCEKLSVHFSCIETSAFLENRLVRPGQYDFLGGTCKRYLRKNTYTAEDWGLTAWVLNHNSAVRIPDLAYFKRDKSAIQQEYPKLEWQDSLNIEETTREILQLKPGDALPPFSFMAVPVVAGNRLLGVVRCCTSKRAPFYFSSADVDVLGVVAAEIGHFWESRLVQHEMEDEISSWRKFGEGIQQLNILALGELAKDEPDKKEIYDAGLRTAAAVIPGAEILDVRLYDPKTRSLGFYVDYGKAWNEGTTAEIKERRNRRFPVGEGPMESAGARVFRTDECQLISDVSIDPFYRFTFPNVKRMIIAPISSAQVGSKRQKYGVLDVRDRGPTEFPRQAKLMATLLGQQLGLYHIVASAIGDLNETLRVQAHSFEDLEHQLRSPIRQALGRLSGLLAGNVPEERRDYNLQAVWGLMRKANTVVRSVDIFRKLHSQEKLEIYAELLTEDMLAKSLIAISSDNHRLLGANYGIKAHVDTPSLNVLEHHKVKADLNLLEQALHNVVENAFKYSHPHTMIQIKGGVEESYFFISVRNQGITLEEQDVEQVTKREWRGKFAQAVTSSGSGIGLWLVDNIMKAHGGRLEIIPTDEQKTTEFRLLFPLANR